MVVQGRRHLLKFRSTFVLEAQTDGQHYDGRRPDPSPAQTMPAEHIPQPPRIGVHNRRLLPRFERVDNRPRHRHTGHTRLSRVCPSRVRLRNCNIPRLHLL